MSLVIGELAGYLSELAANNNKPWFETNRDRYQHLRSQFTDLVQEVILALGEFDEDVQGLAAGNALFRIHRDVRFSKDKTPYKTTFSASISRQGRIGGPGYYFQLDGQEQLISAVGIYAPTPEQLAQIRRFIASRPARLTEVLEDPAFRAAFSQIGLDPLKRPPKGYDENTPHMEYIKLRHFIVMREDLLPREATGDAVLARSVAVFRPAYPWKVWLSEALGG
jgi:uncharacterized protein (TIGR02453 family)